MDDGDFGAARYRVDVFNHACRLIGSELVDQLLDAHMLCNHWSELGVSARLWDTERGRLVRAVIVT
jgi:hypothetical protein